MKDIMNADKYSVDYNCGENNLVREKLQFGTDANTEELIVDAGSVNKSKLDPAILNSDKQSALYS